MTIFELGALGEFVGANITLRVAYLCWPRADNVVLLWHFTPTRMALT